MKYCKTPQKQRLLFVFAVICFCSFLLIGRLVYLMIYRADYYGKKAKAVQQRERREAGAGYWTGTGLFLPEINLFRLSQ